MLRLTIAFIITLFLASCGGNQPPINPGKDQAQSGAISSGMSKSASMSQSSGTLAKGSSSSKLSQSRDNPLKVSEIYGVDDIIVGYTDEYSIDIVDEDGIANVDFYIQNTENGEKRELAFTRYDTTYYISVDSTGLDVGKYEIVANASGIDGSSTGRVPGHTKSSSFQVNVVDASAKERRYW